MTISKDRVKPSPLPDSWKLKEIFATGVVIGTYLAIMTVIFYWAAAKTTFFNVSVCAYICSWKDSHTWHVYKIIVAKNELHS